MRNEIEHVPFGAEWKKELKKVSKEIIIDLLASKGIECIGYIDTIKSINDSLSEANQTASYHIEQSVKKDIEISELKMEINTLKNK